MARSIVDVAVEEARSSACYHQMGAVIFKGSKVISSGHNHAMRSVKKLNPRYQKWKGSVHAEVSAVLQARRDLRRMSIFVVRINNQNQFLLAKPCEHCMSYLEYVGIKHIYYSISGYPFIEHM